VSLVTVAMMCSCTLPEPSVTRRVSPALIPSVLYVVDVPVTVVLLMVMATVPAELDPVAVALMMLGTN